MFADARPAPPFIRSGDWPWAQAVLRVGFRYGLSAAGPVATSAAHFIAALIFLRMLQPAEFGQFSFLLIVVPFCLSMTGALLGAPAALTRGKDEATARREIAALQKASLILSVAAGFAVSALMLISQVRPAAAVLLGLYGAGMTLRAFSRSLAYVNERIARVTGSDMLYAGLLVAGLFGLIAAGRLTMPNAAGVLAVAALLSFLPFGWRHLREMLRSAEIAALKVFLPLWREVARWSLLGVVLTELTANAYAYLVTFVSGPKLFGLLALGGLFMRPASLVLSALPDIDRPAMVRRIAKGEVKSAFRMVGEFKTAAALVLAVTVALSLAVMIWFPALVAEKGYDETEVLIVLGLWIAITALRVVRTPEAVFLQAAGRYSALARVSAWSSATSLIVTLVLLLTLGPIASLGGVLAGEVAIILTLLPLTRAWRRQNA